MASFTNFADVKAGYTNLWAAAKIRPEHLPDVHAAATAILAHRDRYEALTPKVPWWFVGVIHRLEGGGNFNTHLHNGDPLTARTVHVPAGRPAAGSPPFTWEESALDALQYDGLLNETDWSFPKACWHWERFNGFGYAKKGVNSPYVWSDTTLYTAGKYVSDGVFDAAAVSKQVGAAAILKCLIDMGEISDAPPPAAATISIPVIPVPKPKEPAAAMSDLQNFIKPFAALAPTLVTMIAGPAAGLAIKAIAEALSLDVKSSVDDVHTALDTTAPSKLPTIITAAEQIAQSLQPAPVPAATPTSAAVPAIVPPVAAPDISSPLDALFPALTGYKTIIGIVVVGLTAGAHYIGLFPTFLTDGTVQGIEAFAGTLIGVGLVAKVDRFASMMGAFKAQTAKA